MDEERQRGNGIRLTCASENEHEETASLLHNRLLMRFCWHRFLGVALVPLFILAGLIEPGGWFCANGSRCEPAFAVTCCCGSAVPGERTDACCADAPSSAGSVVTEHRCGCYHQADAPLPLLKTAHTFQTVPILVAVVTTLPEPPVAAAFPLPAAIPTKLIRFFVSPGDPRGPPAA